MSEPTARVSVELAGITRNVGTLYVHATRGRESATFEYDPDWLHAPDHFALAPSLTVVRGPFTTTPGQALFGALSDSAPDRWGQTLMLRAERQRARAEGTSPRALRAVDFLLGVTDAVRQGALRFRATDDGPFLAPERPGGVPPLVDLPRLLNATDRFLAHEDSEDDLRLLLAPGSSLGGARPKASVRDPDGALMIAKFPKSDDTIRVGVWEAVALDLAAAAGIRVPTYRLAVIAGRDVLLVRRFDRSDTTRIPYLSAMSLLGARDGETRSYVDLADALKAHGADVPRDLHELFRRIILTVLISNTDDHLRNHGFLYVGLAGWTLSPVFDINPVPRDIHPRTLATPIDPFGDPTASLELAREVAPEFALTADQAATIIREVAAVVQGWRATALRRGLRADEIERMASAFEHEHAPGRVQRG